MNCALFLQPPGLLATYLDPHLLGGLVPVNIQYRQAELRHIFEDAGVHLCLPMQSDAQILPDWR